MGTRSLIGYIEKDTKKIYAIYCHWDGGIDGNGNTLVKHYNSYEKVVELINLGMLSSLGATLNECDRFENNGENKIFAYDSKDEFMRGGGWDIEFRYLFFIDKESPKWITNADLDLSDIDKLPKISEILKGESFNDWEKLFIYDRFKQAGFCIDGNNTENNI